MSITTIVFVAWCILVAALAMALRAASNSNNDWKP